VKRIVECVPNFSEGRRPEVVDAIRQAMAQPGLTILNVSSDADHNRSVITLVGEPEAIEQAAFAGIATAAELIDLNTHRGEHPRIGATDVCPFVPVSGVTMDECVAMARRLGERVGRELGIPVYLYEAAATRPDRQNLENIRHGQYERLKEEIGVNPERAPDFGPAQVGPAGATVIGARPFLIAFNAYLSTSDVSIAKAIAKAIRHSSGGLRYVKALGLEVEGKAQVSMNLTDFGKTPVFRVVEMVRREAARYGCSIVKTELVGLIPQAALIDAAQWYLQIDGFTPDQVLEYRIGETLGETLAKVSDPSQGLTPVAFLEAVAAGAATPGGGAVAALAGALAAALTTMVARLTIGKKKYAEVEAEMKDVVVRAEALRAQLTAAIDADSAAFEAVMAAMKMPKDAEEQKAARAEAIQAATQGAIDVPLGVVRACVDVLELARLAARHGNVNAASDAASASHMARAAIEAAAMNVRINAAGLDDKESTQQQVDELNRLRAYSAQLADQVLTEVETRAMLA
jgi:glutamate formiminotransferase/formiminotetrahydrofolate cyclodeaminase